MNVPRRALILPISMALCMQGCGHGPLTFDSPEQIANVLTRGNDAEQARIKDDLHMPWLLGKDCEGAPEDECGVKVHRATLEEGKENATIEVTRSYDFFLIVLVRKKNGKWRYLDSMPLGAAYNELKVSLESIVSPPMQEIVVHKHVPLHGSGIYQADFLILKVMDGRLRTVLDSIEESHLTQDWNGGPLLMQKSDFEIIPTAGDKKASVRESAVFVIGNQGSRWQRSFYWDNDLRTFEASLWLTYKALSPNEVPRLR